MSSTPRAQPLEAALRGVLPTLADGPRRAAEQILADPASFTGLTLSALAATTGVSESTITRLAVAAGYTGYRELRTAVALAAGAGAARKRAGLVTSDIAREDDLDTVIAKLAAEERDAITDTAAALDRGALERAAHLVVAARSVVVLGIGASGLVALDLAAKLTRIGVLAQAVTEGHAALTSVLVMRPEDLLVVVSSSGATGDILEPLERARGRGIPTVAVSATPRTPVTAADEVLLSVSARESVLRPAAIASRTGQLFVIDVLFTAVAQRTFERAHEAITQTWAALAPRHAVSPMRDLGTQVPTRTEKDTHD